LKHKIEDVCGFEKMSKDRIEEMEEKAKEMKLFNGDFKFFRKGRLSISRGLDGKLS